MKQAQKKHEEHEKIYTQIHIHTHANKYIERQIYRWIDNRQIDVYTQATEREREREKLRTGEIEQKVNLIQKKSREGKKNKKSETNEGSKAQQKNEQKIRQSEKGK